MATNKTVVVLLFISFTHLLFLPRSSKGQLSKCGFEAIYQLGDSIADTGNFIRENPSSAFARLPYGETFFHKATGRSSNGMLIIDYFAQSAGIPFLDAYLSLNATFPHDRGVNFAVSGATALPADSLPKKLNISLLTNSSLGVQLNWMSTYFNSPCLDERNCGEKPQTALFIVGEIGVNDYTFELYQGETIKEVEAMIPDVVKTIKNAVSTVIGLFGARWVIVPGILPLGCEQVILIKFPTNDTGAYDQFHCLKNFNDLSIQHNSQLIQAIKQLKTEQPNATVIYADYYSAFEWLLSNAQQLGFDPNSLQKACCGIGGEYNFDLTRLCGSPGVPVCSDPNTRISWDGLHNTQKVYEQMSKWLISDILPKMKCSA